MYIYSRIAKRRDNDGEDEDDNASRDNTDVAPTPESERSTDSEYFILFTVMIANVCSSTITQSNSSVGQFIRYRQLVEIAILILIKIINAC